MRFAAQTLQTTFLGLSRISPQSRHLRGSLDAGTSARMARSFAFPLSLAFDFAFDLSLRTFQHAGEHVTADVRAGNGFAQITQMRVFPLRAAAAIFFGRPPLFFDGSGRTGGGVAGVGVGVPTISAANCVSIRSSASLITASTQPHLHFPTIFTVYHPFV